MSPNSTRFVGLVLSWTALAGFATGQEDEQASYQKALDRYKETQSRLVFRYQVQGRETLARTRSAAALTILADDYGKSKDYDEHTRYTLASQFGRYFNKAEFVPMLASLRKKFDDPIDTWLWFHTLKNEIRAESPDGAVAIAQTAKKAHQRAAAIAALGEAKANEIKAAIMANVLEFPKKDSERMMLLGAMTGAIWENKKRINDDDYRDALRSYISLLDPDVKLNHTAKVQMARHLQAIFDAPAQFINPEPWLEYLERGEIKKKKDYETSAKPRFFGIETEGERFCYVLDMSDSMLKEISPSARPKGGPITGPRKKRKKKSMELNEGDLPWDRIKTRWDLAREHLRISLSRLPKDKYFSIVWYGDKADTLKATRGMVKASKGNIKKALAELDGIKATYNDRLKREGLRGKTALHYGFQVAFGLGKRGYTEQSAYVEDKPLTEGADTIFLLSDGTPNYDAFVVNDVDYGEDPVTKDLEAGVKAERTPRIWYHGPYSNFPTINGGSWRGVDCWLLRDIRRMNAFRRIKIHCVGLGEANEDLLQCLASLGDGEVFIVGKKKTKPK